MCVCASTQLKYVLVSSCYYPRFCSSTFDVVVSLLHALVFLVYNKGVKSSYIPFNFLWCHVTQLPIMESLNNTSKRLYFVLG